jgi:hypothetical protein
MRRNGHIKESYSPPTASKENKRCNELLHTKKLLNTTKQNKTKKRKEAEYC